MKILLLALLFQDTFPPNKVFDLRSEYRADGTVRLTWTAPSDPPEFGLLEDCVEYDLRYSPWPVYEWNFDLQTRITDGVPVPAPFNQPEDFSVANPVPNGVIWFGMRARDAAGNWSLCSNTDDADPAFYIEGEQVAHWVPESCVHSASVGFVVGFLLALLLPIITTAAILGRRGRR